MIGTDYERFVLEDIFDLIIISKNPWPIYYTKERKIEFLNLLINKFLQEEEYDKCNKLTEVIGEIENAGN